MTTLALARLVVGVERVEEAARIFAERLELVGSPEGTAHVVPIGRSEIELSADARPAGLARLVLRSDDLEGTAERLRARGIPFRRGDAGELRLEGEATHGVAIEIRGPEGAR